MSEKKVVRRRKVRRKKKQKTIDKKIWMIIGGIIAGLVIGVLSGASYQISGPTGAMSAILTERTFLVRMRRR